MPRARRSYRRVFTGFTLLFLAALIPQAGPADPEWLAGYEDGSRSFRQVEISADRIVYYHIRQIGNATVEKDFIVYVFDGRTGTLVDTYSHWRQDLPETLPEDLIDREDARACVEGDVRSARLYLIDPESDVFPIEPPPENPCWVVKSLHCGNLILTVVDAVSGELLGYGIPPPYTAFSMSGPIGITPMCGGGWLNLYQSAQACLDSMGYFTEALLLPTYEEVQSHVRSFTTSMFYEIAHGGSFGFTAGCTGPATGWDVTPALIHEWIADYPKMPFTFLLSCGGMCDTSDGTLSYEFRKGSAESTVTVGACHMDADYCDDCWTHAVDWQEALFGALWAGHPSGSAFNRANAHFPMCAEYECFRFAGDPDFLLVPPVSRTGRRITVDPYGTGDVPTLQAAVDAASNGDLIELADGSYSGPGNRDVVVTGKAVLLFSASGNPEQCTIDCENQGRAFHFESCPEHTSVLNGMTLANGWATGSPPGDSGGALLCQGSSLLISHCRITGSQADGPGGGLSADSASVEIRDSVVDDNTALGSGGGAFFAHSTVTISNGTFEGNTASGSGGGMALDGGTASLSESAVLDNASLDEGGGLLLTGGVSAAITACTVAGNEAQGNGGGFWGCPAILDECLVHGNRSEAHGGALHIESVSGSQLAIEQSTLSDNYALLSGGGLSVDGPDTLAFDHVIVWGNRAGAEGDEICVLGGSPLLEINFSDVDSTGISGAFDWLWYNICEPPGFCDPRDASAAPTCEGDYRLKDASPCTHGHSAVGLMGARDVGCTPGVFVVRPDGSGDFLTIQDAVDGVPDYDIIELVNGTYTGPGNRDVDLRGRALTVRSQSGSPDSCILDCEGTGRAFVCNTGETESTLIQNLTLTGGHAERGGALLCASSSPTMIGCVLHHNSADSSGGGICAIAGSPVIERCTLVENSAPAGAAIHCDASSPTLDKTILVFNGPGEAMSCISDADPVLGCCDVYGNTSGDWIGCIADQSGVDGNFSADPRFYDSLLFDYHLHLDSPCLDVAPGAYAEYDILITPGTVLRSETGNATDVVIDAAGQGRILTCTNADTTTHVQGITFTGGLVGGITWPANAGGALYCENAALSITDCVFDGNAAVYGGAIACRACTLRIADCSFVHNSASDRAAAIYIYYYTDLDLDHSLIALSSQGEAIYCNYSPSIAIACCDLYGNAGGDWTGGIADQEGVNGNFSADPLFCDPDGGNYHLHEDSPCAPSQAPSGCDLVGALGVDCAATAVAETETRIPPTLTLYPAVPNPFNPVAEITYGIPQSDAPQRVVINVYDARGRRVITLVDATRPPGVYRVSWNGTDHKGNPAASGVYFYRITWNRETRTQRMVLLK